MSQPARCAEFNPGELITCPGPGRYRAECGAPLSEVGPGTKARACWGASDRPGPHEIRICRVCKSHIRIEFSPIDSAA